MGQLQFPSQKTSPGSWQYLETGFHCLTLLLLLTVCFRIFPCANLFHHQGKPDAIEREGEQGATDPLGNSLQSLVKRAWSCWQQHPWNSYRDTTKQAACPTAAPWGKDISDLPWKGQSSLKALEWVKHCAVHVPLLQPPFCSKSNTFCATLLLLSMIFFFQRKHQKAKILFLHISTALDMMLLAGCGLSCSVWELIRNWAKCSEVASFHSKCATTHSESFTGNIQKVHAGRV